MTSNSVWSSTAAAPAPGAPGMAATATGAAADTPHFSCSIFDSCEASSRVSLSSCSAISSTLAMTSPCLWLFGRVLAALGEDVRELSLWRLEQADELGQRSADGAHELGAQGFLRRKLGERLQRVRLHELAVDVAALDRERLVGPRERRHGLGDGHRIVLRDHERDRSREPGLEDLQLRRRDRDLRQA